MLNAKEIIDSIVMEQVESATENMLKCPKSADHCRICVNVSGDVWYEDRPKQEDDEEIFSISKTSIENIELCDAACIMEMIEMWLPEAVDYLNDFED
jgi:exosome complex RNA-binding protein Rrp4